MSHIFVRHYSCGLSCHPPQQWQGNMDNWDGLFVGSFLLVNKTSPWKKMLDFK